MMPRRTASTAKPFRVVLVENNPYDRAVLDACFAADRLATLAYTEAATQDGARPIGPWDLWELCKSKEDAPDVVLLDLALTQRCGEALAREDYRHFLRTQAHALREADFALSEWHSLVRPMLVEGTLALVRLCDNLPIDYDEIAARLQEFPSTANPRFQDQKRIVFEGVRQAFKDHSKAPGVLCDYWGSQAAVDTVSLVAQAPSILRLFACVAAYPNRCFGVVSHYADSDTQTALQAILGYRYRSPSLREREEVLEALIVNKAELFAPGDAGRMSTLVERLRIAHELWEERQSPASAVAPFGELPVVTPDLSTFDLWECVEKIWPRLILPPLALSSRQESTDWCLIVWDETRMLVGREGAWPAASKNGHLGWEAILKKDFPTVKGYDIPTLSDFPASYPEGRPVCYVLGEEVTEPTQGEDLARKIRLSIPRFPSITMVFVGGTLTARDALNDGLGKVEDGVSLFRIPLWTDQAWEDAGPRAKRHVVARSVAKWLQPGSLSKRRRADILSQFVGELRVPVAEDEGGNRSFLEALSTATPEAERAPRAIRRIAKAIAADPDPVKRWVELEQKATKIVNDLRHGQPIAKALEASGFVKKWRF